MTTTIEATTTIDAMAESICSYLWKWVENVDEHILFENMIFEKEVEDPDTGFSYFYQFEELLSYLPSEIIEPYYENDEPRLHLITVLRDIYPEWRHAM